MAWVRLDDQVPRNQKLINAGPEACWFWVCSIAYCQSQLTDGFISDSILTMIGPFRPRRIHKLITLLLDNRLLDRVDGGYLIHDYLDHNPSRDEVLARRASDVSRKRSGRIPNGIHTESSATRAGARGMGWEKEEKNALKKGDRGKQPTEAIMDDRLSERAGDLIRKYEELYAHYRGGAKMRMRPALDFTEALTLVQIWDDARLEKLAAIVLTTDDQWISRTDRGFKIFALKASWADNRLVEWESKKALAQ